MLGYRVETLDVRVHSFDELQTLVTKRIANARLGHGRLHRIEPMFLEELTTTFGDDIRGIFDELYQHIQQRARPMSKCDITITTEENKREYRGGDTVRGEVVVLVNKLHLPRPSLICQSKDTAKAIESPYRTPTDHFLPANGSRASAMYPFEVVLPDGPPTYHGEYLNLVWSLVASADIPWAFDPEGELEINYPWREGIRSRAR